jgi:uncharacterized protein
MEQAPVVSVRGEAVLEVEPEIATLRVNTVSRDKDRERAVSNLERRSTELEALLARYDGAVESHETGAVRISPQFKDGKPNEKIVGYDATLSTTVLVVEFARLGDLVSDLGTAELTSVGGPWWSLRPDSDRYRQARVAAAHEAVRRAREYAEALEAALSGLIELADAGLLTDRVTEFEVRPGPPPPAGVMPMAAPGGSAMRAAPVIDFAPARQVVRASVHARFTMTAPKLD